MKLRGERDIWFDLRATRHSPPGSAGADRRRRATYVAALQQAEELFGTATLAGPASRPLPLFYGLSQAGRAIAAAAVMAGSDGWSLFGHGISSRTLSAPLPEITLLTDAPTSRSSFVRLSCILDSPLWSNADAPSLSRIWDTLPEMIDKPLRLGDGRRTPLLALPASVDWKAAASAQIEGLPPHVTGPGGRADLDAFMADYPTAVGYQPVVDQLGRPQYERQFDGTVTLLMDWPVEATYPVPPALVEALLAAVVTRYPGNRCLFPRVVPGAGPLHPLMAWWAVLYTLSMLARYQPAEWADCIDINASQYANAVEYLLEEARTVVPDLVLMTLWQVAE